MLNEPFYISKKAFIELHKRSFKAQRLNQAEVCGLIKYDSESSFIDFVYMNNLSKRSGSYQMYIDDILLREVLIKEEGLDVLGSFHSHPISAAIPSEGDIKNAFYKGVELIHDVCGQECKLWSIEGSDLKQLSIEIVSE